MVPMQVTRYKNFVASCLENWLNDQFIFFLSNNKNKNEKNAPSQHQLIKEISVDELSITFLTKAASMPVKIMAQIRYCIAFLFNKARENLSSVVSNTK